MRNLSWRMRKVLSILLPLSCLTFIFTIYSQHIDNFGHEILKYEVSVNAKLVPVFAVDSQGNPVYDLREEELRLYLASQPVKIAGFKRYEFVDYGEMIEQPSVNEREKQIFEKPERIIFIIIDSVFNTTQGLRRSKKIAIELIRKNYYSDSFVLLEYMSNSGLTYIMGPEKNKDKIAKRVERIKPQPEMWMKNLFNTVDLTNIEGRRLKISSKKNEVLRYKVAVRRFSANITKFKYALQTISRPKLTFLISEGIASGALRGDEDTNYSPFLLNQLQEAARAVNFGGSVLYIVNPQSITKSVDEGASGEMSLMFLAAESGGKYFAGSDVVAVAKRIRKTTSAYYELSFVLTGEMDEKMQIDVHCTRKGVRIHTLNYTERDRPYQLMEPLQRKVFALDVVNGGFWSRMVGKIVKVKYKNVRDGENRRVVEIFIPDVMQNLTADIFLINQDPRTHKTDIVLKTKKLKEKETLRFKIEANNNCYFAIIEPANTYCIYNKIN